MESPDDIERKTYGQKEGHEWAGEDGKRQRQHKTSWVYLFF